MVAPHTDTIVISAVQVKTGSAVRVTAFAPPVTLVTQVLASPSDTSPVTTDPICSTPWLFLDIDGVLAPMGAPSIPNPLRWADLFPGGMHFPADVLDRLVGLHEQRLVRVAWLTSWQDQATTDLTPALNLPVWPVHLRRDAPPWFACPVETDWWKERVVFAALEAGERVIWCDDEIRFRANQDALGWYPDQLLSISPDSGTGLTMEDLDRIEQWAIAPAAAMLSGLSFLDG